MNTQQILKNKILFTDSYKPSHSKIYADGITYMQSYFESRVDSNTDIVFFGLQMLLKKYLTGVLITPKDVDQANEFFENHFGRDDVFDYEGWMYIAKDLNGKLPIRIYALPEGTISSNRTPLMVVESTDEKVFWVVNYVESLLSHIWNTCTVASNTLQMKKILRNVLKSTSDLSDEDFDFVLRTRMHDFGYRGVSSDETARTAGLAFLTSFVGTDNLRSIVQGMEFYNSGVTGISVPATEHSTMTSNGEGSDGEMEIMNRALTDVYSTGIVSIVSDSYDIKRALEEYYGDELRDIILGRGGVLVVRPDSGDPVVTTQKVFEILWDKFGGEINSKGYKVLNPKVRMIQGDGIDLEMLRKIVRNFVQNNISIENIVFGSGGGLLQKFNRDTYKFAFKCNLVIKDGKEVDVRKFPKEWNSDGEYVESFKYSKSGNLISNEMDLVFENGELKKEYVFDEVRERVGF